MPEHKLKLRRKCMCRPDAADYSWVSPSRAARSCKWHDFVSCVAFISALLGGFVLLCVLGVAPLVLVGVTRRIWPFYIYLVFPAVGVGFAVRKLVRIRRDSFVVEVEK